jgi:hypothetical protein
MNATLVNHGQTRGQSERSERLYNFEFTRYRTGSDGLGYMDTAGFDLPVVDVEFDEDDVPTSVSVEIDHPSLDMSYALAASGAAFDPDGFLTDIDSGFYRTLAAFALAPLNMDLGYETWNFSRRFNGIPGTIWDYTRMLTYQRVEPLFLGTDARWIEITDGGHYENLGLVTLARRGVKCIVAVDATADPDFEYGSLGTAAKKLKLFGLEIKDEKTKIPKSGEKVSNLKFEIVTEAGAPVSTVLYLKSNAEKDARHMQFTGSTEEDDRVRLIEGFREKSGSLFKNYPHTSTTHQWFDWETFEAYRALGQQLGRTYIARKGADEKVTSALDQCEILK